MRAQLDTRVVRPRLEPPPGLSGTFPERLALFLRSRHGHAASGLLEGLAGALERDTRGALALIGTLSSPQRQAQLSVHFGVRADAQTRLKALLTQASPKLRCAIVQRLPAWQRAWFPKLSHRVDAVPRVEGPVGRLADRLIREVST